MRLLRPSLIVFCLALLASLCIHLPIYEVLGELAQRLLRTAKPAKQESVEFEINPAPAAEQPAQALQNAPRQKPKAPPAKPPATKPLPMPAAKPEVAKVAPAPVRPPDPAERPLAVTQKSEDPNTPAPDRARFIAEENRRVEQESIARVREMHRDDSEPSPEVMRHESQEKEPGNADQTEAADLRDVRGSRERKPDVSEAEHQPEQASEPSAGVREGKALPHVAPEATPSPAQAPAKPESGPPRSEPATIVVDDGSGSFTIRRQAPAPPRAPGAESPGQPAAVRPDQPGQSAQPGVNLRMSFSQFEQAFGSEQLEQQRTAYLEQRRSRAAGASGERQRMWREFRAAIENYVPDVQPGRQTALNAAADPFAQYLAVVHRRIHREFAEGFLRGLPLAGGPFGDPSLHAELEIVISGDGNVHRVGIAQSSGFLPFDYGAFNAVMRAGPYATPPRKILSGDGRVYVHWGFYRNERQCGTFNARPFILPHPPGSPKPSGPLRDDGDHGPPHAPVVRPGEGELGVRE